MNLPLTTNLREALNKKRFWIALLIFLIILAVLLWKGCRPQAPLPQPPPPPPLITPSESSGTGGEKVGSSRTTADGSSKNAVQPNLIPKTVTLVRCYYEQGIVGPNQTISFNINGSGFTRDFLKSLDVTFENALRAEALELVTPNQIRGKIVVLPDAKTAYVYPTVRISQKSVFVAPNPFAVIRPGEVLAILLPTTTSDGRSGRFKVLTNLDEAQSKTLTLRPSAPGLEVSPLELKLPFTVEGSVRILNKAAVGEYGLIAYLGEQEIFRNEKLLHIMAADKGMKGIVRDIRLDNRFYRPGDVVAVQLEGNDLTKDDLKKLHVRVQNLAAPTENEQFISKRQLLVSLRLPTSAEVGSYHISVLSLSDQLLVEKREAFAIVPSNWILDIKTLQPATAGKKGTLEILGRDFTDEYVKQLTLAVEGARIQINNPQRVNANTLHASIEIGSDVPPGDYVVQIIQNGKKTLAAMSNVIRVQK